MTLFVLLPVTSSLIEPCVRSQPQLGLSPERERSAVGPDEEEQLTLEGPEGGERRTLQSISGRVQDLDPQLSCPKTQRLSTWWI